MPHAAVTALPAHHSTEEILAHPRFAIARNALLEAMLDLYDHKPFLNRLLLEVGRNVLFVVIACLHARHNPAERATWPTMRLVKDAMGMHRLASPRRVDDLVARLIKTGYLQQRLSRSDGRVRILVPTPKMLAQDRDWLVSHYAPLQMLFPRPGYAPIMKRDPAFQLRQRLVAASFFPLGASILERNPLITKFLRREAGTMILIKIMHLAAQAGDITRAIVFSEIGTRFGVSRTQVRLLLEEAARDGLVHLVRREGKFVQLTPKLVQAFDHFLADGMAGHDLIYNLASQADVPALMKNVPLLGAVATGKEGAGSSTALRTSPGG
jgi:hypothetical protein